MYFYFLQNSSYPQLNTASLYRLEIKLLNFNYEKPKKIPKNPIKFSLSQKKAFKSWPNNWNLSRNTLKMWRIRNSNVEGQVPKSIRLTLIVCTVLTAGTLASTTRTIALANNHNTIQNCCKSHQKGFETFTVIYTTNGHKSLAENNVNPLQHCFGSFQILYFERARAHTAEIARKTDSPAIF